MKRLVYILITLLILSKQWVCAQNDEYAIDVTNYFSEVWQGDTVKWMNIDFDYEVERPDIFVLIDIPKDFTHVSGSLELTSEAAPFISLVLDAGTHWRYQVNFNNLDIVDVGPDSFFMSVTGLITSQVNQDTEYLIRIIAVDNDGTLMDQDPVSIIDPDAPVIDEVARFTERIWVLEGPIATLNFNDVQVSCGEEISVTGNVFRDSYADFNTVILKLPNELIVPGHELAVSSPYSPAVTYINDENGFSKYKIRFNNPPDDGPHEVSFQITLSNIIAPSAIARDKSYTISGELVHESEGIIFLASGEGLVSVSSCRGGVDVDIIEQSLPCRTRFLTIQADVFRGAHEKFTQFRLLLPPEFEVPNNQLRFQGPFIPEVRYEGVMDGMNQYIIDFDVNSTPDYDDPNEYNYKFYFSNINAPTFVPEATDYQIIGQLVNAFEQAEILDRDTGYLNITTCGGFSDPCDNCIQSFAPFHGEKYVLTAWVKESLRGVTTYENAVIEFTIEHETLGYTKKCFAKGQIIDGWQRIEYHFTVPEEAETIQLELLNLAAEDSKIYAFFDDVRIHPYNANMKTFVYDPDTFRLMAELDENNYATFFEYDEEGGLIRVKKETERGIKTIRESRTNVSKLSLRN